MNERIQVALQCMLEGTMVLNESKKDDDLDLKNEKWCSCKNPTGFRFVKVEGSEQIWRHITCGGLVVKSFINRDSYR